VETYAAVRQGGETLRRRRRPGRNIPPPRECARGNVRFAPPAKKILRIEKVNARRVQLNAHVHDPGV